MRLQKCLFLLLFLLTLGTLFNSGNANFAVKDAKDLVNCCTQASLKPYYEKVQVPVNVLLAKFQIKSRLVQRWIKFINPENDQLQNWQTGRIISSFKILFSIYDAFLFNKVPDARISLLSSRAHPPTHP